MGCITPRSPPRRLPWVCPTHSSGVRRGPAGRADTAKAAPVRRGGFFCAGRRLQRATGWETGAASHAQPSRQRLREAVLHREEGLVVLRARPAGGVLRRGIVVGARDRGFDRVI